LIGGRLADDSSRRGGELWLGDVDVVQHVGEDLTLAGGRALARRRLELKDELVSVLLCQREVWSSSARGRYGMIQMELLPRPMVT